MMMTMTMVEEKRSKRVGNDAAEFKVASFCLNRKKLIIVHQRQRRSAVCGTRPRRRRCSRRCCSRRGSTMEN